MNTRNTSIIIRRDFDFHRDILFIVGSIRIFAYGFCFMYASIPFKCNFIHEVDFRTASYYYDLPIILYT